MAQSLNRLFRATRRLGVPWLAYRSWKALADKSGWTQRRLPVVDLSTIELRAVAQVDGWADAAAFFEYRQRHATRFLWDQPPAAGGLSQFDPPGQDFGGTIDRLARGSFQYFSSTVQDLGRPPDWFRNPYFHVSGPRDPHFSRIGDFRHGDIKAIWELSRFGFVFELARAHSRRPDPRCGQLFWELFEDWCWQNPVNQGVNWKCGQEAALRAIAITFGAWVFAEAAEATPDRLELLSKFMHFSAVRIEKYLGYALHQNNNHSISEAAGLFVIGLMYPELHQARRWRDQGQRILDQEIVRLFFADGGFVQFSGNYQRMALQILTLTFRLAERHQIAWSELARQRVAATLEHLASWVDPLSGGAPRFGNDDGSLLFPLSNLDYSDYRPALQAAGGIVLRRRMFEAGPWDEELVWMGGDPSSLRGQPSPPRDLLGNEGGLSVLQGPNGRAVFRCGQSRFRPAQLDLFHVDIWQGGKNLALDPGTYSYNADGQFARTPLAEARYHNTVSLNNREPAERIGVFLFDPWPAGRVRGLTRSPDRRLGLLQAERVDTFVATQPVTHRRAIVSLDQWGWLILDQITSLTPIPNRLHWLLDSGFRHSTLELPVVLISQPSTYSLTVAVPNGAGTARVQQASPTSPDGWYADRYLRLQPAVSLQVETAPQTQTWLVSVFSPSPPGIQIPALQPDQFWLDWPEARAEITWNPREVGLISNVRLTGNTPSELSV